MGWSLGCSAARPRGAGCARPAFEGVVRLPFRRWGLCAELRCSPCLQPPWRLSPSSGCRPSDADVPSPAETPCPSPTAGGMPPASYGGSPRQTATQCVSPAPRRTQTPASPWPLRCRRAARCEPPVPERCGFGIPSEERAARRAAGCYGSFAWRVVSQCSWRAALGRKCAVRARPLKESPARTVGNKHLRT